ncbi:hypothetical protein GWK47_016795 [Chionoecetes opilio]|uniref:WHIM2 domain-containing protein n=1 Tax=Chionoecetes opilio TaxID=41210 RepID=A0A8J4Y0P7_CHIOP|nr:hypothetical protein GWK47_016795 [Chionoecetes opilio]
MMEQQGGGHPGAGLSQPGPFTGHRASSNKENAGPVPPSQDTEPASNKENAGPVPPRPPPMANPPSRPLHLANGAQANPKAEAQVEHKEEAGTGVDVAPAPELTPVYGLCTADPESCPVHVPPPAHHRWHFFHHHDQLPALVDALNPRGQRERRLQASLTALLPTCRPPSRPAPSHTSTQASLLYRCEVEGEGGVRKSQRHTGVKKDTNLTFPLGTPVAEVLKITLTDILLETEDKLHVGMLGCLTRPLQRLAWRDALVSGALPTSPPMDYGGRKHMAQLKVGGLGV